MTDMCLWLDKEDPRGSIMDREMFCQKVYLEKIYIQIHKKSEFVYHILYIPGKVHIYI